MNCKKVLTLSLLLLISPIILFFLFILGVWIYSNLFPVGLSSLPKSLFNADIAIETWGNKGDGHYIIHVKNDYGELKEDLWTDWGPAQRANFYRTQEGWLAILGAGRLVAVINTPDNLKPYNMKYSQIPKIEAYEEWSKEWTYLGSIDGYGQKIFFRTPAQTKECFATFIGLEYAPSLRVNYRQVWC